MTRERARSPPEDAPTAEAALAEAEAEADLAVADPDALTDPVADAAVADPEATLADADATPDETGADADADADASGLVALAPSSETRVMPSTFWVVAENEFLYQLMPKRSGMLRRSHPLDTYWGQRSMKMATARSESSCWSMMTPGFFGPEMTEATLAM